MNSKGKSASKRCKVVLFATSDAVLTPTRRLLSPTATLIVSGLRYQARRNKNYRSNDEDEPMRRFRTMRRCFFFEIYDAPLLLGVGFLYYLKVLRKVDVPTWILLGVSCCSSAPRWLGRGIFCDLKTRNLC
jgi:hypothetical protein